MSATTAHATLTIQAGQSTYSAAPNGSATVVIKMVETGGTTQLQDAGGMFSFGFSLSRTQGDATVAAATRNPAFDKQVTGSTLSSVLPAAFYKLWAEQDANFGLEGPGTDGSRDVTLATLSINAGATGGRFQLADFNGFDQTVLYDGSPVDSTLGFGSFIIVVPEPTSLALIGLITLPLLARRSRFYAPKRQL